MDVMMPQMDGPQTLIYLREQEKTAKIPVVFMTARAQQRELQHFLSLGAAGVIAKPFDPMALAGSLRQYLKADISLDALRQKFMARAKADAEKLKELAEQGERARRLRQEPRAQSEQRVRDQHARVCPGVWRVSRRSARSAAAGDARQPA